MKRSYACGWNPAPDKQTQGARKQKMRLLVRGDTEPKEWNEGKSTDAPTANASIVKMMVALADTVGAEENLSVGDVSKAFVKSWLYGPEAVSYTHLRAHETPEHLVCRLLLEKKKKKNKKRKL
eukprot:TRINITY_DN16590_c0_g1_i6.p1 TRINITY_DN16590_c0_g1~~TRINITY_DN16590_c0_g1_i6.p1  ORF type:complete len:123 (+),score=36.93 TRINITY_DN16590_c0_g1_i6:269-637(+)